MTPFSRGQKETLGRRSAQTQICRAAKVTSNGASAPTASTASKASGGRRSARALSRSRVVRSGAKKRPKPRFLLFFNKLFLWELLGLPEMRGTPPTKNDLGVSSVIEINKQHDGVSLKPT